MKTLLSCVLIALVVSACSNQSGIVTKPYQMPIDAGASTDAVTHLLAGTEVKVVGDEGDRLKVDAAGTKGWIDKKYVAIGAKAGVINGEPATLDGSKALVTFTDGQVVAYDSVKDDKVHVYYNSVDSSGWIEMKGLSTKPEDVEMGLAIAGVEYAHLYSDKMDHFKEVAAKYPSHERLQTIKVKLDELPDNQIATMQDELGIIIDKSKNSITTSRFKTWQWVNFTVSDVAWIFDDPEDPDGLLTSENAMEVPRIRYFHKYILALPEFVKMPVRSVASTWPNVANVNSNLAFIIYRMDRSPENVKMMYDKYKGEIVYLMQAGVISDLHPQIMELIASYDHIVKLPNYQTKIASIQKKITSFDNEHIDDKGVSTSYVAQLDQADIYEPIIDTEHIDPRQDGLGVWYYSFWVRRFAEGNAQVVYDILKELSEVAPEGGIGEEDYDDGEGYAGDSPWNEEAITCVFQGFSFGDCGHIEFSCGDYGDADTSALSEEERKLWDSLVTTNENGEDIGNPDYVGKEFIIRATTATGPACNEGQGGEGPVPKLLEFRVKE